MKTYLLKGKNGNRDIALTIEDLIPLPPSGRHDYERLVNLINYSQYEPEWDSPMIAEYDILYSWSANRTVDFFKIRDTGLIVIPGRFVYPTILTELEAIHIIQNFLQ